MTNRYLPTNTEPLPVREQLTRLIQRRAPGASIYKRALDEISSQSDRIAQLEREVSGLRLALKDKNIEP